MTPPAEPPGAFGGRAVPGALRRVLVVEDDLDVRDALADLLRAAGYGVAWAGDGAEAMRALRDGPRPDAILLDLMMPGMDGYQFRAEQQSDPGLAEIPVVLVTAARGAEQAARTLGAASWVAKPAAIDVLLAAIARALGEPQAAS